MPRSDRLDEQLDRLAAFQPTGAPVVSLYLDARPDQHGRDNFEAFLRRESRERRKSYAPHSAERESLDHDITRIEEYLRGQLAPETNSVAIFASSGSGGFFEAIQLATPLLENWLYLADQPQLYPLARVQSQYPRYAAVLADTASARILVFSTGQLVDSREVKGEKTRGRSIGGWSQSRYQRRVDNVHAHLVKELVAVLERVVRDEGIQAIVLAGDDVVLPLVRAELPKTVAALLVEDLHLPVVSAAHEVLEATTRVLARNNEQNDRQKVEQVLSEHRGRGLGVVGVEETLAALDKGQVDELLIAASLGAITPANGDSMRAASRIEPAGTIERGGANVTDTAAAAIGDRLVTRARQTGARITFIEAPELLAEVGGVAASLRFRV